MKMKMEIKKYTPLLIVKVLMFSLFLLFSGGALVVTLDSQRIMNEGWTTCVSWMWLPALFFLGVGLIMSKDKLFKKETNSKKLN